MPIVLLVLWGIAKFKHLAGTYWALDFALRNLRAKKVVTCYYLESKAKSRFFDLPLQRSKDLAQEMIDYRLVK